MSPSKEETWPVLQTSYSKNSKSLALRVYNRGRQTTTLPWAKYDLLFIFVNVLLEGFYKWFYCLMAITICLHVACGCFHATAAELSSVTKTLWPTKPLSLDPRTLVRKAQRHQRLCVFNELPWFQSRWLTVRNERARTLPGAIPDALAMSPSRILPSSSWSFILGPWKWNQWAPPSSPPHTRLQMHLPALGPAVISHLQWIYPIPYAWS
jgi:hypothetical protein